MTKADIKERFANFKWKHYLNYVIVMSLLLIFLLMDSMGMLSRSIRSLLLPITINIILAVSLNLLVGYLGVLTLGHAGFMCVGAYAGCIFAVHTAAILPAIVRFPLALIIGGIVAAIFGLIIGIPVLRLKGDYLAIVTLAFGEVIRNVILNLGFTGGAIGLRDIPDDANFVIGFVLVLITLIIIQNLIKSKHGRAITAIRDNEISARSMGINVTNYKLLAFVAAAFFAGVAGVLYGHYLSFLKPTEFDYNKSIEILVMVVLGGMGSITGSIIAATVMTALPEMLRVLADYRLLIYAIVLIAMMIINNNPTLKGWVERAKQAVKGWFVTLFKCIKARLTRKKQSVAAESDGDTAAKHTESENTAAKHTESNGDDVAIEDSATDAPDADETALDGNRTAKPKEGE